jgi:nucleotide-binding universal stress UspA family protein
MAIARILVPIDFSSDSRGAMEFAAEIARALRAEVTLLHVWNERDKTTELEEWWATLSESERAAHSLASVIETSRHGPLNELAVELHRLGVSSVETRLEFGAPAPVILKLASSYNLVVIGSHGRSGVKEMFVGSVAERIARRSPVPVLVVPSAEAAQRRSLA